MNVASAASNGSGSESWALPWAHLKVDRRSSGYCRVTFDHPPINALTATTVAELAELVGLIEQDRELKVVVFDSANPDFYLGTGPTGTPAWTDLLLRLARAPVVSVASIRGRAPGAGSEFALACDLRFASRENTLVGRFEVPAGAFPGSGTRARLAGLVGRGRALEILLLAGDLDGPRAELYGFVNRAIPDERLDAEVEAVAARLASFDHDAIAGAKSHLDRAHRPADSNRPDP